MWFGGCLVLWRVGWGCAIFGFLVGGGGCRVWILRLWSSGVSLVEYCSGVLFYCLGSFVMVFWSGLMVRRELKGCFLKDSRLVDA